MEIHGTKGSLARLVVAVSLIGGYVFLLWAYHALLFSSQF